MKTKLFTASLIALSVIACKKEVKLQIEQTQETQQTTEYQFTIKQSTFSSTDPEAEKSCAKFNDEINALGKGINAAFQELAKEQYASLDSAGLKPSAPYELFITDSVFSADGNFISVLVSAYQILGGANGNTDFYGLNYNMKKRQFLQPKDILDYGKAAEINALLKAHLTDPCYTFEAPTIENLSALTFTPNTIEFTYAKYILGPGACGPVTISVPYTEIQGMLKLNK